MMDEDCVERIYKDAEDLFLSVKLRKGNKVSLDEVIAEIGEHVVEDADSTEIIRKMRDRRIRRICKPYSIAGPHRNRVCCFRLSDTQRAGLALTFLGQNSGFYGDAYLMERSIRLA